MPLGRRRQVFLRHDLIGGLLDAILIGRHPRNGVACKIRVFLNVGKELVVDPLQFLIRIKDILCIAGVLHLGLQVRE